jgi:putative transposase
MAELAERGIEVDYRKVWSFVDAEKLSFKKTWWLANATAPTSHGGGRSGSSIRTNRA